MGKRLILTVHKNQYYTASAMILRGVKEADIAFTAADGIHDDLLKYLGKDYENIYIIGSRLKADYAAQLKNAITALEKEKVAITFYLISDRIEITSPQVKFFMPYIKEAREGVEGSMITDLIKKDFNIPDADFLRINDIYKSFEIKKYAPKDPQTEGRRKFVEYTYQMYFKWDVGDTSGLIDMIKKTAFDSATPEEINRAKKYETSEYMLTGDSKALAVIRKKAKMDGIRALMIDGKLLSRSFKTIPNNYIRTLCEDKLVDGLDGELLTEQFNLTAGDVMRESGEPDFHYYVFDYVKDSLTKSYLDRIEDLKKLSLPKFCIKVIPVKINNVDELMEYEEKCIQDGFEGVCIRLGSSKYKEGRGTLKACDLVKIKRFEDAEAKIIGFGEQMKNENKAEKDNFGRTKRSSAKDGMVGKATLGTLEVKIINGEFKGVTFSLGTGFNDKLREEIWNNKDKYINKIVTFKYQPIGSVNAPRIPVFKGFRDKKDM